MSLTKFTVIQFDRINGHFDKTLFLYVCHCIRLLSQLSIVSYFCCICIIIIIFRPNCFTSQEWMWIYTTRRFSHILSLPLFYFNYICMTTCHNYSLELLLMWIWWHSKQSDDYHEILRCAILLLQNCTMFWCDNFCSCNE